MNERDIIETNAWQLFYMAILPYYPHTYTYASIGRLLALYVAAELLRCKQ